MADIMYPIANGFYGDDSRPISGQECVGWIPNFVDAPALNQEVCFGQPGLSLRSSVSILEVDNNRGSLALNNRSYFVQGNTLFRHNEDTTNDNLGTIDGTGFVDMAENGTQLMILVPGGAGYIFTDAPDTLVVITDPDFISNGAPQHLIFIDSLFLVTTDLKKFIISSSNDGTAWNSADFGSAESSPDAVVAPFKYLNELFIAGTTTIEGFNNAPSGADFPFVRSGLFFDEGVSAPNSIVNVQDSVLFIGLGENESPVVWRLQGNSTTKVSSPALDTILGRLTETELQAISATTYNQRGQYFARFNLPETTFVFNTITSRWHEDKSVIIEDGETTIIRNRVNSIVAAYGKLLVGDSQDGRIGEIDIDVFSEYGQIIFRRVAGQPFSNQGKSFFVPMIELTMEAGVGNTGDPDPQIRMDRSRDGGFSFKQERKRGIGRAGQRRRRTIWYKNGQVDRYEVFRWTMTDKVKPVLIKADATILPGEK